MFEKLEKFGGGFVKKEWCGVFESVYYERRGLEGLEGFRGLEGYRLLNFILRSVVRSLCM